MQNPYDVVSNNSFGYICQDCKYFENGCNQKEDGDCICTRFQISNNDKEVFDEVIE